MGFTEREKQEVFPAGPRDGFTPVRETHTDQIVDGGFCRLHPAAVTPLLNESRRLDALMAVALVRATLPVLQGTLWTEIKE
jgi:hypothetical protein